jgi:hypothetical protein
VAGPSSCARRKAPRCPYKLLDSRRNRCKTNPRVVVFDPRGPGQRLPLWLEVKAQLNPTSGMSSTIPYIIAGLCLFILRVIFIIKYPPKPKLSPSQTCHVAVFLGSGKLPYMRMNLVTEM